MKLFEKNPEKGVSLIITFFIMGIALSVVLGISSILFTEIQMIRDAGNSVAAFYLADSGVEATLYFDNKNIPTDGTRGICDIGNITDIHNIDSVNLVDPSGEDGCDLATCAECDISFNVSFPGEPEKKIDIFVSVSPSPNDIISSRGTYKTTTRAIEIKIPH
jgi:hypothetical protein